MKKVYKARRDSLTGATVVIVTDKGTAALPPRRDLMNHSPDGFEWGYAGSGPAQLALALCIDALDGNRPIPSGPCFSQHGGCFLGGPCVCGLSGAHNTHECKRCGETWGRTEIVRVRSIYQDFKARHIAGITDNEWSMTAAEVRRHITELEQERERRNAGVTA